MGTVPTIAAGLPFYRIRPRLWRQYKIRRTPSTTCDQRLVRRQDLVAGGKPHPKNTDRIL